MIAEPRQPGPGEREEFDGRAVNESHHSTRIPNDVVNQARELHEQLGLSWRNIAKRLLMNPWTVYAIVYYRRRPPTGKMLRQRRKHDQAQGTPEEGRPPEGEATGPDAG